VELTDYYQAVDALTRWVHYYNDERPHAALACLRPIDYYRGDPQARLQERRRKLAAGQETRGVYWSSQGNGRGGENLSRK